MSTATELITEATSKLPSIDLGIADNVIAGIAARLENVDANTKHGYEITTAGIKELTKLRTGADKSKKELKKDAIAWNKAVNTEFNRVKGLILAVEEPLREKKAAVDNAARIAAEQAAEKERLEAEREERERREAEQAALKAEQDKLAAEREEFERQKAEVEAQQKAAQEKIEAAERAEAARLKAIEDERIATERKEQDRQQAIEREKQAEKEVVEAAEQNRLDEIEATRVSAERAPDVALLREFAAKLRNIQCEIAPSTKWGQSIVIGTYKNLDEIARYIESQLPSKDATQCTEAQNG